MALGNKIGFKMDDSFPSDALYLKNFGGILIEAASEELPGLLAGRLYHRLMRRSRLPASPSRSTSMTSAFEGKSRERCSRPRQLLPTSI